MQIEDNVFPLNIGNICEGSVPERFEIEVAKVLENIDDVNTDPEDKREVVLKFVFLPAPDRKSAVVTLQVKTKLAGMENKSGSVFFAKRNGKIQAYSEDPRQVKLFASEPPATDSKQ